MSCSGLHRYILNRSHENAFESRSVRRRIVFDGKKSWIHCVLGVLSGLIPVAGIGIAVAYLVYQLRETEKYVSKLGDFIEFLYGYVVGDIMKSIIRVF